MDLRNTLCSLFAAAVLTAAFATPDAHARVIRFDLGGNWAAPTFLDLAVDGSTTVDLGFEIDFGLGATSQMTIHEDGFVTFGAGQQITLFEDPGFDFASRIPDPLEDETPGALTYSPGVFDLGGSFGTDPTDTFRVSWYDPPAGAAFQLLLRTEDLLDPGNFLLEFNYGCDPTRVAACELESIGSHGSKAGLTLGDNTYAMSGPFTSAQDYDFRFVDGVLVDAPVAVPEPGSLALLLGGLWVLGLRRRRSLM